MRKRQYIEKRPKRFGAMQVQPTRHTEPSYFRSLLTAGLIERNTDLQDAYGMWQRVCADGVVKRLSMKLDKVFLPSVAAPYQHGAQVLAAMSEHQLDALRQRIGVK